MAERTTMASLSRLNTPKLNAISLMLSVSQEALRMICL